MLVDGRRVLPPLPPPRPAAGLSRLVRPPFAAAAARAAPPTPSLGSRPTARSVSLDAPDPPEGAYGLPVVRSMAPGGRLRGACNLERSVVFHQSKKKGKDLVD